MELEGLSSLPYLTRNMLSFGDTISIELVVTSQVISSRNLMVRLITRDGFSEFVHTNSGTGLAQTTRHRITDIPILISVIDEATNTLQGDAYATLSLSVNGEIIYQLAAGYVYRQKGISWPQSMNNDVIPNRGGIRVLKTAIPNVGEDALGNVPGGQMFRVLWASVVLTTSATVASRRVHLQFGGAINAGINLISPVDQLASTTKTYTFAQYGTSLPDTANNEIHVNLPADTYVVGGELFTTLTYSFQAADAFSALELGVEQLYEKES